MQNDAEKSADLVLRIIDVGERAVLLLLFLNLAVRLLFLSRPDAYAYILVFAEGLTVAFVLVRRYTHQVTLRPFDWAVAFAGTMLPLLVSTGGSPLVPQTLGSFLMVLGLLTSLGAKLSLRRSYGIAAANRGVKSAGLYRYVRHPMYLGYLIIYVGFLLLNPTWINLAIYTSALVCQVLRIFAEEHQLKGDPLYLSYMERVRYRLVPGLF